MKQYPSDLGGGAFPEWMTVSINEADMDIPMNRINTTKYNPVDFLPKNLYFQFSKPSNLYFLVRDSVVDFSSAWG